MRLYLYIFEILTALFALVAGVSRWKQLSIGYQLLLIQLLFACSVELTGKTFDWMTINNQPLFNVYLLVEMWLLIIAARTFFTEQIGKVFCMSCILLGTMAWACFFCFSPIHIFAFPLLVLECFLQSAVYLTLLISFFSRVDEIIHLRRPEIWLITGTLIYFSGNIPLFCILTFLDRKSTNAALVFNLNILFLCLRYAAIGAAFALYRSTGKTEPKIILREAL